MPVSPTHKKQNSGGKPKLLRSTGARRVKRSDTSGKDIPVNLRVPSDMLQQIDATVHARRLKTPRTRWILEAICEKLDREADDEDIRIAEDRLLALREGRSRTYPLEEVLRTHGNLER